jgi:hypothetical protein
VIRRNVALPLAAFATALAAVLAACGGPVATTSPTTAPTATPAASATATDAPASPSDSAEPSATESEAVAGGNEDVIAAADATIAEGTVRIEQTLEFNGSSLIPDGTSATTTGQASFDLPRQMIQSADLTELGQGPIDMIVDDTLVYMSGSVFDQLAGEGNWLLVDLESEDPRAAPFKSLATGQNDVGIAIVYLYGMTGAAAVSEGEEINGVATTLYEGTSDLEAAQEAVPDQYRESFEVAVASLRAGGVEPEVETQAWVGDDGLVHRVRYVYALGPAQGGGSMETVIDFFDFGAPMELGIPSDDEVVSIDEIQAPASAAP